MAEKHDKAVESLSGHDLEMPFIGCPYCDLLVRVRPLKRGYNLCCPRCGAILVKPIMDSVNRTMAFSLSGLFLFIPACFLPILKLKILGFSGYCTMIKGVIQMFLNGYWWMTFLVLFCSVIVPLVILSLLSAITISVRMGYYTPLLTKLVKLYHALSEWTMLDVYMIGILIAFIKMKDYGEITVGPGLFCFAGLLCLTTLTMISFDVDLIWDMIEERS